jgi:predicted nucleic acid-binding protein
MVLVDTTVWIDFFVDRNEPHVRKLQELIENEEDLSLCGVIMTEILQGIRSDKFIFIHIIKTGGVSIATALNTPQRRHITALETKNVVGDKIWNAYFKFAFVRNPWDKIVSQYHYNGINFCKKIVGKELSFEEYVVELIDKDKKYTTYEPSNFLNIVDENGKVILDYIGRFEDLQNDFNIICDKIGVKRFKLPHKNSSKHKHYREYYNSRTKRIVAEKFAQDIEYFGYKF